MLRRFAVLAVLSAAVFAVAAGSAMAKELRVDDDGVQCKNADSTSINGAIALANPGDKIKVCPGTYVEQVKVPAGKDNLTLESEKPLQAIIQAPPVMASPKAIVQLQAQNTKLQKFTIQGPGGGPCDSIEYGVRVDGGGSATIEQNHITHIHDTPFSGCQNGNAVQIGRAAEGQIGSGIVKNNQIDDYQKTGVVVSNTGSDATVENNDITGVGPTAVIAQNGIQVSSGANARVKNNNVSNNQYSPQTVADRGILLFDQGTVTVENNTVTANDVGISALGGADNATTIKGNKVSGSVFDGIDLEDIVGPQVLDNKSTGNNPGYGLYNTDNGFLKGNKAEDNGTNGFFVDNQSQGNTLRDNQAKNTTGIDCEDDSTGPGTSGTANFWINDKGATSSPPGICKP
jgi:parallel beta-helix repeat protein